MNSATESVRVSRIVGLFCLWVMCAASCSSVGYRVYELGLYGRPGGPSTTRLPF